MRTLGLSRQFCQQLLPTGIANPDTAARSHHCDSSGRDGLNQPFICLCLRHMNLLTESRYSLSFRAFCDRIYTPASPSTFLCDVYDVGRVPMPGAIPDAMRSRWSHI